MHLYLRIFTSLLLAGSSKALVARSNIPPTFTVQEIGVMGDSNSPNVYRDGGGGGRIGGKNVMVFSDTTTTTGGPRDPMKGFTSNSIVYSTSRNPTAVTNLGSGDVPELGIPFLQNETDYTSANWNSKHLRIAIWPGASIATFNDNVTGVAVYPVVRVNGTGSAASEFLYSTLVTMKADDIGLRVERTVPHLFCAGEIPYGGFSSAISNTDGNLLLFASAGDGVKVARVSPDKYADRSQYTYWNGTSWKTNPPPASSTASNIFTVPVCSLTGNCNYFSAGGSSGDIFYSAYFKTWLAVYFDGFPNNIFRMRWSLDGMVTGKWSESVDLYETVQGNSFNYAGHAYPGFDGSGRTLVLGWTWEGREIKMARVVFG